MTQDITTKVTIIGAGPAGATLSLLLSKHKIHHVIIDKAIFPRDKICGDGFTYEALRALKAIDESIFQEFINADWTKAAKGSLIVASNGDKIHLDYSKYDDDFSIYYVAKREIFDNWLVSKINSEYAQVYFGHSAEQITRTENKLNIKIKNGENKIEINTDLLIGADGERSIVRKTFHPEGLTKNRDHYCGAIRVYYKGVEPIYNNSPLEFYLTATKVSYYVWIFYLPNGEANVGIGALSSDISEFKVNLKTELNNFIANNPILKERFKNAEPLESHKGWGIPLNSDAYDYVGDNYLLIGDSAKFCEPFTGKGIGISMFASLIAVPTIIKAINNNRFSKNDLIEFEKNIEKKFRKEWTILYKAQSMLKNKTKFLFFVKLFAFKPITKWMEKRYITSTKKFVNKPYEQ